MKRDVKTWLFNPFMYVAGMEALIAGLVIISLSAIISSFSFVTYDGVLDSHLSERLPVLKQLENMFIDWLSIATFLTVFGFIFSKSTARLVDIYGTQALARMPILLSALMGLSINKDHARLILSDNSAIVNLSFSETWGIWTYIIFMLPLIIWCVVLMYRSYSISFNIKGTKAILTFIAALILSEITSKLLIRYLA
jgi:hypothetical protein